MVICTSALSKKQNQENITKSWLLLDVEDTVDVKQ